MIGRPTPGTGSEVANPPALDLVEGSELDRCEVVDGTVL